MFNIIFIVWTMVLSLFQDGSVHNYTFTSIDGEKVSLADFKGKKILIINTASKCGYTKQYEDLQKLSDTYKDNLVLIGFPSGDFGGQELDSNEEIIEFCQQNYGVTFLMAEKTHVKGKSQSDLFKYLTNASNPDFTGDINWNFEKFLIDENGKLMNRFRSKTVPFDSELISKL